MYKGVKVSTNKAVLENCDNPISNIVISWRKLSGTQSKVCDTLLILSNTEFTHNNIGTYIISDGISIVTSSPTRTQSSWMLRNAYSDG